MNPVKEIFWYFFRTGWLAFGGPLAHLALLQRQCVQEKKWLDEKQYAHYFALTSLIPGPSSTEMAILIGHHRGGIKGNIVAGLGFIIPAALLSAFFAFLFQRFGKIPFIESALLGLGPIIFVLIVDALIKLTPKTIVSLPEKVAFGVAFTLGIFMREELNILIVGFVSYFIVLKINDKKLKSAPPLELGLIFFKIGATLYGTGLTLIAYVENEFIRRRGWLSYDQLSTAIGVGQVTPGPVFSSATFLGYVMGGPWGAFTSSLGIFLPAFIFVALGFKFLDKMRSWAYGHHVMSAINSGALALLALAAMRLCLNFCFNWRMDLIALLAFGVNYKYKQVPAYAFVAAGILFSLMLKFI